MLYNAGIILILLQASELTIMLCVYSIVAMKVFYIVLMKCVRVHCGGFVRLKF